MMKKTFLLFSIFVSVALTATAQGNSQPDGNASHGASNATVHRAPKRTCDFANVFYDEATRMVEITSNVFSDAEVLLCDELGNVVDHATALNTSFYIPQDACGCYSVRIECGDQTLVKYIIVSDEM